MQNIAIEKNKMLNSKMISDYRDDMIRRIKLQYPDISEKKLKKLIDEMLIEKVKEVPIVTFENNHTHSKKKTTLIDWYNWYKDKNPITTEHGVCYRKHDESVNLSAKLLEFILNTRKAHKKAMFKCKQESDEDGTIFHDLRQKVFKIFANSYYGAMGQVACIFYNLFTALSITGKGQSLITNAAISFETFLGNNFVFESMDDIYIYVTNIVSEERIYKDSDCLTKQISSKKLKERLMSKISKKAKIDENEIEILIDTLSKQDKNRVYYKNNLFEFCANEKILPKIYDILDSVESFKDPNAVPENIQEKLDELWDILREWVFYNYTTFNHAALAKTITRRAVVVVDTDSNMLNLEPWIDFVLEHDNKNRYDKDNKDDIYKIVNLISYILGVMIKEVHQRYTAECNVPEDKRPIIDMKNEFLMRRLITTSGKKNYASLTWLQEGVEIPEEDSLDIKGLTIKKSNVNKAIGKSLQDNLEMNILKSKNLDINVVLSHLRKLESKIRKSFSKGEVLYSTPSKSNEPSTYAAPFQQQTVRGIYTWNCLYPDKEITYPAQVNLVKLKIENIFDLDLEKLKQDMGEEEGNRIYNIIEEKIFHKEELAKYGVSCICIPKNEENIPQWLISYIDVDNMVYDGLNNFNKILNSIGVKTIPVTASDVYYSNIIDF